MASINYATREISCKIVYYGPGLSGKTTNLQIIHRKIPDKDKSEMVSLATETDRTLFFDFLPLDLGSIKGFATKFQLYTVPGQVYYNATRKLVLRGVDGVVFVVDSQADKLQENLESFQNLQENLREYGHSIETIPVVLQFNKRDLPNIYSIDQLNSLVNKYGMPYFEAVASTGVGVFTTLKGIGKSVIDKFNAKYSGFQGSRRPAASPAAAANAIPAVPPRPQPQAQQPPPMAQPAYQAPQPPQAQPSPPPYPSGYSAPAPQAPGGFPGSGPMAPLTTLGSGPMGSNSPLGPFQTPSANPFQSQPPGMGTGPSPFGGQGGPGGFPPAAQPGPTLGQPPGQFVPPTGGGKPFPGFGNAPPILGQPPQQGQPGPSSPFNNPFNSAPSNAGGSRSPFGSPPSVQPPQPGIMGHGPMPGPGPASPSQVPLSPQVENFGRPSMPPSGVHAPMAPKPFAPPGGMQNPMGGSPFGQNPVPSQNPAFGGPLVPPSPSPFGAPSSMPPSSPSPFGSPMPGPGQGPASAPFGGGPSPFPGPGMNTQGGFPPPLGNPGIGMGQPGGQPALPFANPPPQANPAPGPGPSPFGNPSAFGGPGGAPMGGSLGNAHPASRPPGPGEAFQQPGYGNPGGYNASSGPMPMPPLGDGGGADNHSGIVSTYEDMQRDDNFKTRKIPLPSEKKKGFFDGLFKKDA